MTEAASKRRRVLTALASGGTATNTELAFVLKTLSEEGYLVDPHLGEGVAIGVLLD